MYRREYPDVPGLFDARFSEYNRPSLWRELQSSWFPSLVGFCLVITGCSLLLWNEARAVRMSLALEEGLRDVTVPETLSVVFEENNGKLVLISGPLDVPDPLVDEKYGISIKAAKLRKVVQVYQWFETEDQKSAEANEISDNHNHEKTYSYDTDWYEYHIDSSNFFNTLGHHNPHLDEWPLNSSSVGNSRVKIGGYLLGTDIKKMFTTFTPFTSDVRPKIEGVRIYAGLYYHSANLWQPEVGDYRVQFSYSGRAGDEFTVVGRQAGREVDLPDNVRPYKTEGGEELLILQEGIRSPAEVFRTEQNNNRTQTWLYRLGGWLATFLGLTLLSQVLELALDLVPRLRQVLALQIGSLTFSVSLTLTLGIIGLGWLLFRPLLGFALLLLATAPYIVPFYRLLKDRRRISHRP